MHRNPVQCRYILTSLKTDACTPTPHHTPQTINHRYSKAQSMLKAFGKLKYLIFDKGKHNFVDRHGAWIGEIYQNAVLLLLPSGSRAPSASFFSDSCAID